MTDARAAGKEAVNVTQKDGYEVWTVPQGETVVITMGDGETIENVLIDQTAPGANLYISAPNNPSGWAIRNVGWRGVGYVNDVDGYAGLFHMTVSGDGVVENVFIDNRTDGTPTEIGGALLPKHHSGTVECRNTFIAGCGNNAFYGSNPGSDGGNGGQIKFYNCYHRDNTVSQFRLGTPGSVVENCVGIANDPNGARGVYPNTTSRRARGVWCRANSGNTVRNSVMYVAPNDVDPVSPYMVQCYDGSNAHTGITFEDARGNDDAPEGVVFQRTDGCSHGADSVTIDGWPRTDGLTANVLGDGGVPASPEMAARGQRRMPTPPELTSELTITSETEKVNYEFSVGGSLEKSGRGDATVDDHDTVDGATTSGHVWGGTDAYRISGGITDFRVDGPATVRLNGKEVEPTGLGLHRFLKVESTGGGRAEYSVTVDGNLQAGPNAESGERPSGNTASGGVGPEQGVDDFRFSGFVTDFALDGPANVYVDGEQVDPGAVAKPHVLTIDGGDGKAEYEVAVSGGLAKTVERDATVDDHDVVSGNAASGHVWGGRDSYRFGGEITDLRIDGPATVLRDGEEVDPATLG